mgnify:CR=1 FL=1|tara:strand:+ start:75 stop:800 length:726 start_codon:yes stop_codon:yes gene_type:complete
MALTKVRGGGVDSLFDDEDSNIIIGRGRIGNTISASDHASFQHRDLSTGSNLNYAILQTASGGTQINSSSGQSLFINIGNSQAIKIDSDKIIRMENQPAFNVNVNSTQTLSAGSTTTVTMDTERFDQNADFNTSTYKFVAPVTGRYFLSTFIRIDHIDISSDYIDMRIRTSNHTYQNVYNSDLENTADGTFKTLTLAVLADMDANDEAYVTVFVEGHVASSTGTTSINTGGSSGFFGYLAC